MIKARLFYLAVVVLVVLTVPSFAQLTCTSTAKNFVVSGSNYSFDIYAMRTSAGTSGASQVRVGISSFLFNVDQTGAFDFTTPPALSNVNTKYTGVDRLAEDYGPMYAQWSLTSVYKVNVTIDYSGNNIGTGLNLSTTGPDGELICTVTLKILNTTKTATLTWDQVASAITTSNSTACTNSFTGSDNSALPVEVTSFTASSNRLTAQLNWSTATEKNNYGFDVERRMMGNDATEWTKVGFVSGAGTKNSPTEYTYTDNGVAPGRYAYRIKQIDNDGAFKYASSAEVEIGLAAKVLSLSDAYPNPFNPSTMIEFTLPSDGRATLKVYNTIGQEVANLFDGVASAGRIIQGRFDAKTLATGLYFARLQFDGKTMLKKMLFVK
jgi:hypothetical protein